MKNTRTRRVGTIIDIVDGPVSSRASDRKVACDWFVKGRAIRFFQSILPVTPVTTQLHATFFDL
jgi:hypothetical protein